MDTKRAQALQAHLSAQEPEDQTAQRIVLNGNPEWIKVRRVPIRLLMFNIRNGRFAAELLAREKTLKRHLDPTVEADANEIQQLLLNQDEAETTALREDLVKHGQLDPGIATYDGAVINANRRMAVLRKLHFETGEARYECLRVSVLPLNVSQKDLWRIEAGLQFAKDFRLEYGPINELLKLKEGRASGLTDREIAASLLGRYTEKQVADRFEVLKLIESYLATIGKPEEYQHLQAARPVEKFNSLHSNVLAPLKRRNRPPPDVLEATEVGFALIKKEDVSYLDIRKLAKIYESKDALDMLRAGINLDAPMDTPPEELDEAFTSAKETVEAEDEREKPERLVNKALAALKGIDVGAKRTLAPKVQTLLRKLSEEVNKRLQG